MATVSSGTGAAPAEAFRADPTRVDAIRALIKAGAYNSADSLASKVLEEIEAESPLDSMALAETLELAVRARRNSDRVQDPSTREMASRALEIREKLYGADHPQVADILNTFALYLAAIGDESAARRLHERALAIRERSLGPDHLDVSASLTNLANATYNLGDRATARGFYERALAIREKVQGKDHPSTATILVNLGNVHFDLEQYDAARPCYERAIALWEKSLGPDHPHVARTVMTLANLYTALGKTVEALPLYNRALASLEKQLGPEHRRVGDALYNIATSLRISGDRAGARPYYERALAIHEKILGPDHPDLAETRAGLAYVLGALRENRGALEQALLAEAAHRNHFTLTAAALSEREALQFGTVKPGGLPLALTLAAEGLDPISTRRVWDALIDSRALVLETMARRRHAVTIVKSPDVEALFADLSRLNGRLAGLIVQGVSSDPQFQVHLEEARADKERAERALAAASSDFDRALKRDNLSLEQITAALPSGSAVVAYVSFRRTTFGRVGPSEAPRQERDTDSAPSYMAFVFSGEEAGPVAVPLGDGAQVDSAAASWRHELSLGALKAGRTPEDLEADCRAKGEVVRRLVWDPLEAPLAGAERVFVVPDGSLNLINLEALPTRDGGYLAESGPLLHLVTTERNLADVDGGEPLGDGLLAMGGPSFDNLPLKAAGRPLGGEIPPGLKGRAAQEEMRATGSRMAAETVPPIQNVPFRGPLSQCREFRDIRFPSLPGTTQEVDVIASIWNRSHGKWNRASNGALPLKGRAATEEALKRDAPGKRILHVATHGFFINGDCLPDISGDRGIAGMTPSAPQANSEQAPGAQPPAAVNPLTLSGLALAGANQRQAAGPDEEDGILTAEEIAALDLNGMEWAVLSACNTGVGQTGVGRMDAGEGVFGLRRALQIAGVRTVISSLWQIRDEVAREWMKTLYECRFLKGHDTAQAVHEANLQLLKKRRSAGESTHPFYWAGFVAAGDWR